MWRNGITSGGDGGATGCRRGRRDPAWGSNARWRRFRFQGGRHFRWRRRNPGRGSSDASAIGRRSPTARIAQKMERRCQD
ncbi:hypothetical protein FKM82_022034 [Ascaphus truei]